MTVFNIVSLLFAYGAGVLAERYVIGPILPRRPKLH